MSGGGVEGMMQLALLFASLLSVGNVCEKFGCPALIGEIVVGVVLGPEVFNVVPHVQVTALDPKHPRTVTFRAA